VSRGDLGTVRRHLDSLDAFDPQAAALYRQLALRTVWLAQTKGVLNEEQLAQLREWLGANSD
jgi:predicted short-subunit dehydrogenase-like oxidoreductase (DUF2520 family)